MTAPKTVNGCISALRATMPQSCRILCDAWGGVRRAELGAVSAPAGAALVLVNAQDAPPGASASNEPGAMCYWHADPTA